MLFLLYIFLVFLILLNIFLAIIAHSYDSVYEEMEGKEDPFAKEIYNSFKKFVKRSINLLRGSEAQELEGRLNDELEKDGDVTREDLMDIVKGTDLDVDKLMAKYDTDGDGMFNTQEIEDLLDGIDREETRETLVKDLQEKGAFGAAEAVQSELDRRDTGASGMDDDDNTPEPWGKRTTAVEMTAMSGSRSPKTLSPVDPNAGKLNLGSAPGTPRVDTEDKALQNRVNGVESKLDEMMKVLQAALPKKAEKQNSSRV